MEDMKLDAKVQKFEKGAKNVGTVLVVVATAVAVGLYGATLAISGVFAILGLVFINLVPVVARQLAMLRQKSLTAIAEHFSEETIRDDEKQEADRILMLEDSFKTQKSELEHAMEELHLVQKDASEDEKEMIQTQIQAMKDIVDNAYTTLVDRKKDFEELKKQNKLYIALSRSASAMEKAQGANRNTQEIQNVLTARTAIKQKMRSAMAGKQIEAMNEQMKTKEKVSDVASFASSTIKPPKGEKNV
jgi:HAMP domain-containing protein